MGNLRAVIGIPAGQHRSDDLACVGVRDEVEHLPGPAPLGAVLLLQPTAGTAQPQTGAVHQQVHRLAPAAWPRHLQRLGPTAQGGMVRHSEVDAQQLQNGADQPFGLAQGQAEHGTQRQGGCDRQVRVLRLAAPVSACLGAPPLDRFGREPHREAAAGAQAGVILSQLVTFWRCLGMRCRRSALALNGMAESLTARGLASTPAYSKAPD